METPAATPKFIAAIEALDTGNNFQAFIDFCTTHPTLQAAWEACDEPYHLLWLLMADLWTDGDPFGSAEHRKLVGLLCQVSRKITELSGRRGRRGAAPVDASEAYASPDSDDDVSPAELRASGGLIAIAATAENAEVASAYAATVATDGDPRRIFKNQLCSLIRNAYPTAPALPLA